MRILILQFILMLAAIFLCYGCLGTEVPHDWKTVPELAAANEKFSEIVVNVLRAEDTGLGDNMCEHLQQQIEYCIVKEFSNKYLPVESDMAGANSLYLQVVITRYDDGIAFSKWTFQEPRVMCINSYVLLSDWKTKKKLARFELAKRYDRYDSSGRLISNSEIESEFAQEVVTLIAEKWN